MAPGGNEYSFQLVYRYFSLDGTSSDQTDPEPVFGMRPARYQRGDTFYSES